MHDDQCSAQRCSRGHTDQRGVGQWIAKQALHSSAAYRQCGTHDGCQQHARQTDLAHDQRVLIAGLSQQCVDQALANLGQRQADCTTGQAQRHGAGQDDGQCTDQQSRALLSM